VVDLRIYRASFAISLICVLVVAFSLEERDHPLPSPIAPDAVEGAQAYGDTARLAGLYPRRKPGSVGDERLGDFVEARFRALGFHTTRDRFDGQYRGDDVRMSNVTGLLNAPSDRQVVVIAPRDAAGQPGASSAASTAVLLQLATALDGSSRKKTFVFVSTDGSAAGEAGARRFADTYPDRGKVDAVVVVDDIGAVKARAPYMLPWSTNSERGSVQVARTASAALTREAGVRARTGSWEAQFLRQAWPVTLREQGPLIAKGLDAVTITSRGEVPRGTGPDGLDGISRLRLQMFGRAVFASVLAYDGTQFLRSSPPHYILIGRKLIPGWAISLLAIGLVIPAVMASVDAFARARRRGLPIGRWARWTLTPGIPIGVTLLAAFLFELIGWLPATAAEALAPASRPSFGEAVLPLLGLAVLFALAWILLRPLAAGSARRRGAPGAAAAVALALLVSIEVLLVCVANPFVALALVPVAHLCLLAELPETPKRSLLVAATLVGLLLPALGFIYYGDRLGLGLDPARYALMVVTSATGSPWTALLGSLVAGTLVSTAIVAFAIQRRAQAEEPVTVRGPITYAGPGSLGGTESALRRQP
jgi:hypothetical protein